jgi:hypothetical protein
VPLAGSVSTTGIVTEVRVWLFQELARRLDGFTRDVNAVQGLISAYTSVCSTDLTGPNGPAVFDFPCRQKI